MKHNWKRLSVIAIVTALAGLFLFSNIALAQGPGPVPGTPPQGYQGYPPPGYNNFGPRHAPGFMGGWAPRGPRWAPPGSRFMRPWAHPGYRHGPAFARGRFGLANSVVSVTADVLDMDRTEIIAQLREGKSIADIAGDKLDEIVDALVAKRQEKLNELVADGRLTQEQADALVALMKARITDRLSQPFTPRGFGEGQCPGWGPPDGRRPW